MTKSPRWCAYAWWITQHSPFWRATPIGGIIEIGCGLDTRFYRVDNGTAQWYELDLPPVIAMRRQLLGDAPRTRLIDCSVFDLGWMDLLDQRRPFLFVAEGVFPYFQEREVKQLVLALKERFPGAELVFDAIRPVLIGMHNLELSVAKIQARLRWGTKGAKALEGWSQGIHLLDEWFYFDQPEALLRGWGWMRFVPVFNKSASILHYRLEMR